MLLLVELLGQIGGGSQRWLNLGVITLQPSELMKPTIVLAVALFFDRLPPSKLYTFDAIWPPLVLMGLPSALVLLQPDLGTTITIVAGGVTVAFMAGLPMRLFVGAGAAIAVIAPLAFFFVLHDYQRGRVTTFLDPSADPLGTLYVEPGIPAESIAQLRAMGHTVEVVDNGIMFGGYQAIARDPATGVLTGATEMRKDGQA